jgi:1-acyl-sn-glycerol-3-phosphate acyltransferase
VLEASHKIWAEFLFERYLKHLFNRHFTTFNLFGIVPQVPKDVPILILPNHNSWWDGFFVHNLNKRFFQRRLYVMMLEEQLRKYPFFRYVGAYGIIPDNPHDIRKSINYTVNIIEKPPPEGAALCMFPQGELVSWYQNPLNYQRGIEVIIRRTKQPLILLPLMSRIEYLNEQYPHVFFLFGTPIEILPGQEFRIQQLANVTDRLRNDLKGELIKNNYGHVFFSGRRSEHTESKMTGSDINL